MVVFALKNMNFLTDAAKKEAELKRAEDELDNISADMHKLDGRKQMIWEDYTFAVKYESALESVPEADIKRQSKSFLTLQKSLISAIQSMKNIKIKKLLIQKKLKNSDMNLKN